jgi:hypothetical protein
MRIYSIIVYLVIVHIDDVERTEGPRLTVSHSVGRESPRNVLKLTLEFSQIFPITILSPVPF